MSESLLAAAKEYPVVTLTGPRQAGKTTLVRAVFPDHGYCNLFENMVVVEAFKARLNAGREPHLYFWQDSHHNEVDLVFDRQRNLIPIEIKSAMTWHRELAANVLKFQRVVAEAKSGFVLYAGDLFPETDHYTAHHFKDTCDCLMALADR